MPSVNQYESRTLVSVLPFQNSGIEYGFKTNVNQAVRNELGHVVVDLANAPAGLIIGANSPKPGRASQRTADQYNSSFYDYRNYGALRAAGWSTTLPSRKRGRTGVNTRSVFVIIQGIKYAWNMPVSLYNNIGAERAQLGISDATQNDTDLVWGASFPQPPRVSATVVGAGGTNVLSTFCDPTRLDNLPDGWSSSGREFVTLGG
jgi:hypothetical protein